MQKRSSRVSFRPWRFSFTNRHNVRDNVIIGHADFNLRYLFNTFILVASRIVYMSTTLFVIYARVRARVRHVSRSRRVRFVRSARRNLDLSPLL